MFSSTRNPTTAYALFSQSITYFVFYRMLGIISLMLVMSSSLFLILWYSLLTGSQIIDSYMEDIYLSIDVSNFDQLISDAISMVSRRVNTLFGQEIIPETKIKTEKVEDLYDTDSNFDTDSDIEDVTDEFEKEPEIIDLTQEEEEDHEEEEYHEEEENHEEEDEHEEEEEHEEEDEHEEEEEMIEANTSEKESLEQDKPLIPEHIESTDSDTTDPMGSTDNTAQEKKPKKKHHGGVKHGKGKHLRMNQIKHENAWVDNDWKTNDEAVRENDDYTIIPSASDSV